MTDNPKSTTGEIGLMNVGAMGPSFPEQLQQLITQLQIQKVMGDVIRDVRYNPEPRSMAETPGPTKARNGWLPETPITSPPGQDLIERMTNQAQPHGPMNPLSRKSGEKNE
jgi:hypothetical protein